MKDFVILADVQSDMSEEMRNAFGVTDYVHGYVHFSDGRDFKTALDWSVISREDFYKALSDKKIKISTAPASPEEYYNVFKDYAEKDFGVISISLSSKVSSTHDNAVKAAARVNAEYHDCEIYALDGLRMSGALALMTCYAHEMKSQGKTMKEIVEWLEDTKHKVHQMGPIDDLMFVARRGSISSAKAIMGSFAGVKPMGDCNRDGYVNVLAKAKGMKKALKTTVEYIRLSATNIEDQYVFLTHSNREEYALALKEMIENELHPKKVFLGDVFCAAGTNIGPGMVCAYYIGDYTSQDGEKEKETMNKALENCR